MWEGLGVWEEATDEIAQKQEGQEDIGSEQTAAQAKSPQAALGPTVGPVNVSEPLNPGSPAQPPKAKGKPVRPSLDQALGACTLSNQILNTKISFITHQIGQNARGDNGLSWQRCRDISARQTFLKSHRASVGQFSIRLPPTQPFQGRTPTARTRSAQGQATLETITALTAGGNSRNSLRTPAGSGESGKASACSGCC